MILDHALHSALWVLSGVVHWVLIPVLLAYQVLSVLKAVMTPSGAPRRSRPSPADQKFARGAFEREIRERGGRP